MQPIGQAVKDTLARSSISPLTYRLLTLMKAAPALSIEEVRNPYHHKVPHRSLSLLGSLLPTQTNGTVAMSGTNMITRCTKRSPVAIGSQI